MSADQDKPRRGSDAPSVLIVDDEQEIVKSLVELVRAEGYHATGAEGGRSALRAMEEADYDLVITDLAMPDVNGWQLLEQLKARPRIPRTVLMTGFFPEHGQAVLLDSKSDAFLVKPIDSRRLLAVLRALLNPKNLGRAAEVVIIDDDRATLKLVEKALSRRGIFVDGYTDSEPAVTRMRKSPPDLAILDLNLRGTSGFDVCRFLRGSTETVLLPILILTASPSRDNVLKAVELQVNGFIAKPFDPPALVEKVLQTIRQTGFRVTS